MRAEEHGEDDGVHQHDQRERHVEGEDHHERGAGHGPQPAILQGSRAEIVFSPVLSGSRDQRFTQSAR